MPQHLNLHGTNLNTLVLVITAGSLGKSQYFIDFPLLLAYFFLSFTADGTCSYQWNLNGYFAQLY